MVYKQGDYTLYKKDITLRGSGKIRPMYFFSKKTPKAGEKCDLPEGYEVVENEKTGLLFLRRLK